MLAACCATPDSLLMPAFQLSAKLLPRWCWSWLCSRDDCKSRKVARRTMHEELLKGRRKGRGGLVSANAWRKAIPQRRDRLQSELLTGVVGMLLVAKAAIEVWQLHGLGAMPEWFWVACGVSAGFALVVWLLRSATGAAAALGGVICLNVLLRQGLGVRWQDTAMPGLLALFLLTFTATRFGRARKEAQGTAEARHGR